MNYKYQISSDLITIENIRYGNNIMRTSFGLEICLCKILTNDPNTKKLYSSNKKNYANQRSPAGHRIAKYDSPYHNKY